jgi:PadR family transcriptional regulator, regulatory protein PadR
MPQRRTNPDYLNGVPELLILKLLSRRPMHGYELVQSIALLSRERLEFGEGCIYPLLHRLEVEGALSSARENVGGRSRVVYRVSAAGQERLEHNTSRWCHVVEAVQWVLQGGVHGHIKLA